MATTGNNLSVPAELFNQARRIAEIEGRTADELTAEALKRYIEAQPSVQELHDLADWGARHAKSKGFKPSDVDRAISEVRQGR